MHAIVTGHSRGLGAALADNLLARGFTVLGLARHPNGELASRYGDRLRQIELDLSDAEQLCAWLEGTAFRDFMAEASSLLLINNAGTLQPTGPLGTHDARATMRAIQLNTTAPLLLANAVAATATSQCERRIVHISSGAARSAYAGWSVYCASKSALDHHARAVSAEGLAGVRICSVAPGVVDTAMQAEVRSLSESAFPQRSRFVGLWRDGGLASAAVAADAIVCHALWSGFGGESTWDVRGG